MREFQHSFHVALAEWQIHAGDMRIPPERNPPRPRAIIFRKFCAAVKALNSVVMLEEFSGGGNDLPLEASSQMLRRGRMIGAMRARKDHEKAPGEVERARLSGRPQLE